MLKKIVLFILSFIAFYSNAQEYEYVPFPDSGAIWSEVYHYSEPIWPDTVVKRASYERYTVNGEDTIINEIGYKKLYMFYDSVFNKEKATCIGGIREDENKRVYFKGDTVIHDFKPIMNDDKEEILLYDFSVEVGDTIRDGNFFSELVVERIDRIEIDDKLRKVIYLQDISHWVNWIEGIGSVTGLLYHTSPITTGGPTNYLICFKQNNEVLYFDTSYDECYPKLTGLKQRKESSTIEVFPNPATDKLCFNFNSHDVEYIKIVDFSGRTVALINVAFQQNFILNIEKYQPGVYLFKTINKEGIMYTGKFIVE